MLQFHKNVLKLMISLSLSSPLSAIDSTTANCSESFSAQKPILRMSSGELQSFIEYSLAKSSIQFSDHTRHRLSQQSISLEEFKEILDSGRHIPERDEYNSTHNTFKYTWQGFTNGNRHLRLILSVRRGVLIIVTAVDLDLPRYHKKLAPNLR